MNSSLRDRHVHYFPRRPRLAIKPILCTSIAAESIEKLAEKASKAFVLGSDLVELRLDAVRRPSVPEAETHLSKYLDRSILTLRSRAEGGTFQGTERDRLQIISKLAALSFHLIDVELDTIISNEELYDSIGKDRLIVSWHNLRQTPPNQAIQDIVQRATSIGAYTKVVTLARDFQDNINILSLYKPKFADRLIAFCMGELGVTSRFVSIMLGCPIAYCSLPSEPVASGQVSLFAMQRAIGSICK